MVLWSTSGIGSLIEPSTLSRQVWDAQTARTIPGVGRALQLYGGLIASCVLSARRGDDVLPTPRLLERPDPDMAYPTFVGVHVEDYLLHGNACHLVTVRDARSGRPAAVRWYPAHRWGIQPDRAGQPVYLLDGREVPRDDVIHVQRGADPAFPHRGVGVVEQHVRTLNRAGLQEAAEAANLTSRGMPSVAIIAPNAELGESEADAVADKWVERFSGPEPKPALFPKDTQVIPLAWNPSDAQMVEARAMTVKDVANVFNLDGYWLGAEGSSHTYRSPGPMFLILTRVSLGPVMDVFEDVWSFDWLPRGQEVRFDRTELLRDDLTTMVQAFTQGRHLFPDPNEPRRYMGFPALPEAAFEAAAPPPPPAPADDPDEPDPDVDQDPADDDQEDPS